MKMDALYQHAADLDLDVQWSAGMAPRLHGLYFDDEKRIVLNYDMTQAQALAALAHEIAHATFGDRCSSGAIERRADEFGATFIIDAEEYAAAEEVVGPHPGAIARELGVTRRAVLAWRRWWKRHHPEVHTAERGARGLD